MACSRRRNVGFVSEDNYDVHVDSELSYVPYWIGVIDTNKARALPIYPDKRITFYLVCDALNGDYIVLRNIPKVKDEDAKSQQLLPICVSKDKLENVIMDEAIKTRINKQFIFGPPQILSKSQYVMYLPVRRVLVKRKTDVLYQVFYINVYTGEAKEYHVETED